MQGTDVWFDIQGDLPDCVHTFNVEQRQLPWSFGLSFTKRSRKLNPVCFYFFLPSLTALENFPSISPSLHLSSQLTGNSLNWLIPDNIPISSPPNLVSRGNPGCLAQPKATFQWLKELLPNLGQGNQENARPSENPELDGPHHKFPREVCKERTPVLETLKPRWVVSMGTRGIIITVA
jgi:hypothetical protein